MITYQYNSSLCPIPVSGTAGQHSVEAAPDLVGQRGWADCRCLFAAKDEGHMLNARRIPSGVTQGSETLMLLSDTLTIASLFSVWVCVCDMMHNKC